MPAPGSTLRYGNRDYIFSKDFYKTLVEKHKLTIPYSEAAKIIKTHNKILGEAIRDEEDGFKLPKGLGYICAVKYKPKKDQIDWKNSQKYGKKIYHTNLSTFGYTSTVKLFKVGRTSLKSVYWVYMFKPCKKLFASVFLSFKNGEKAYQEFTLRDFIQKSKVENLYQKKVKNNLEPEF